MVDLLYRAIYWVAEMHDHILNINNAGGWYFDDKQLHFIVIGLLGMMMIFVTYPVFKLLASTGHTMVISWLYTFTVVLVVTFAIEIGQWFSGTGKMDTEDMASGIAGFLIMFLVFAVIRAIFLGIVHLFRGDDPDKSKREAERVKLRAEAELNRQKKVYKKPEERRKMNLADLAHEGGSLLGKAAAGGKAALEGLAEEYAEEKIRTAEMPTPDVGDRMTFVMPAPEEVPWTVVDQGSQTQVSNDDVEELFAEFERAAADEIQISGPDQQSGDAVQNSTVRFSEQNSSYSKKRPDMSERPVYKQ